MARQHRELYFRLDNAEQLRRYAQSSKYNALDDALGNVRAKSKHWERKTKKSIERAVGVEKERDEAKEEAQHARMVAVVVGDAKARVKNDLARV